MSAITHKLIAADLELAVQAIEFFTSEVTNPPLFNEIKNVCAEQSKKFNKHNVKGLIEDGYFSLFDFSQWYLHTKKGTGYKIQVLEHLVDRLCDNLIIIPFPELVRGVTLERRFKAGGERAKWLNDRGLILNVICGWKHIINKYSESVVKIEHKDRNGDFSIGTGFYFAAGNNVFTKAVIVTNKHVVDDALEIKVYTKHDKHIAYHEIILDPKQDLAFIIIDPIPSLPTFQFNPQTELLEEIITIGFPAIPMTPRVDQVFHKGEINSFTTDYNGNQLILFSAKTAAGNSGSPILDSYGMVVGIITEELFEQSKFYQKGQLPYYAGIPSGEIIRSLNEHIFVGSE